MGNLAGDSPHIPHTSPISDCSYSHKWGIWGNLWGVPKITPHLSKPLYIGFSSNLGGISQKRYISKFLKIAFLLSHCDVSLILCTISWWLCVLHHTSSIRHQTSKKGSSELSPAILKFLGYRDSMLSLHPRITLCLVLNWSSVFCLLTATCEKMSLMAEHDNRHYGLFVI